MQPITHTEAIYRMLTFLPPGKHASNPDQSKCNLQFRSVTHFTRFSLSNLPIPAILLIRILQGRKRRIQSFMIRIKLLFGIESSTMNF